MIGDIYRYNNIVGLPSCLRAQLTGSTHPSCTKKIALLLLLLLAKSMQHSFTSRSLDAASASAVDLQQAILAFAIVYHIDIVRQQKNGGSSRGKNEKERGEKDSVSMAAVCKWTTADGVCLHYVVQPAALRSPARVGEDNPNGPLSIDGLPLIDSQSVCLPVSSA